MLWRRYALGGEVGTDGWNFMRQKSLQGGVVLNWLASSKSLSNAELEKVISSLSHSSSLSSEVAMSL